MAMNIDLFDEYASQILADLFQSFPVKIGLDATQICGHTTMDDFGAILNDQGKPSKHFEVARGTIEWLLDSGYIRSHHGMSADGLTGAVLTAKGLSVLQSMPQSLKGKESLGDRLASAVRSGGKEAARDLLQAIFAKGADMAVAAMP